MHKPTTRKLITLESAAYKSSLAASLYEVILERAGDECSPQLLDLISIVCDFNTEISLSLKEAVGVCS